MHEDNATGRNVSLFAVQDLRSLNADEQSPQEEELSVDSSILLNNNRSLTKNNLTLAGQTSNRNMVQHSVPTQLRNLESALSSRSLQEDPQMLPENYTPGPKDICCGRGKRNWNHAGNVSFRTLIQTSVGRYIEAPNKTAKTGVVVSIVDDIRRSGAYFLKQDDAGRWYDIGDQQAREKVGHSLRDQVTAQKKNAAQQQQDAPPSANNFHPQYNPVNPNIVQPQVPTSTMEMQYGGMGSGLGGGGMGAPQYGAGAAGWNRQSMHIQEPMSDDEEDLRRQSLGTTALLEEFGRRPSWIEMSFTSTSTPSSSLRSAALTAAAALEDEEQVAPRGGGNLLSTFDVNPNHEGGDNWNPRASAMSMMSLGDNFIEDLDQINFANVFRGSLSSRSSNTFRMSHRKSSVNWLSEQQQKDLHSLFDNSQSSGFGETGGMKSSTLNAFAEIQRLEASGEMHLDDED